MAAALAAGAAGVRLGTRSVASVEADFHADYKALLVEAGDDATVYTERFGEPSGPTLRTASCAARSTRPRPGRASTVGR